MNSVVVAARSSQPKHFLWWAIVRSCSASVPSRRLVFDTLAMATGSSPRTEPGLEPTGASALSALSFMNAHMDEPFRLPEIAEHLGYSAFHSSRLFREAVGIPPGEFLTALRFQRAKQLLINDDAAVIDICTGVGFSSLATFTRRFHQWVGVTPAALRTLASTMSERPTTPFSVGDPRTPRVTVTVEVRTTACCNHP